MINIRLCIGFAVFIGLAGWSSGAQAATFYVATNGSDGYSCAQAQSASTPKLSLNNAVTCLGPGSTLYVRGGDYDEVLIINIPSGSSWDNKVRIAAYPGETVWLRPSSSERYRVIEFSGTQQYIEFDGINLDATRTWEAIKVNGGFSGGDAHHIRVQNAEVIGGKAGSSTDKMQAIIVTNPEGTARGGNEFINLTVHGGGHNDFSHTFYIQASDTLIDGCNIYDAPGAAIHAYNDYGASLNNIVIRNNVIHDGRSTGSGQRHWGIILANGSTNAKVYNNILYGMPNDGGSSVGIYAYTSSGAEIYNNTVYGNGGEGVVVDGGAYRTIVQNNISYNNAGGNFRDNGSSTVASNNLTDGTNPLFVNAGAKNFRLQASSAAIDAGTAVSFVTDDLSGAGRPQGRSYDIGALEGSSQAGAPGAPNSVHLELQANN